MMLVFCLLFCSDIPDGGEGPNCVLFSGREPAVEELGVGGWVLLLLCLLFCSEFTDLGNDGVVSGQVVGLQKLGLNDKGKEEELPEAGHGEPAVDELGAGELGEQCEEDLCGSQPGGMLAGPQLEVRAGLELARPVVRLALAANV